LNDVHYELITKHELLMHDFATLKAKLFKLEK